MSRLMRLRKQVICRLLQNKSENPTSLKKIPVLGLASGYHNGEP